MPLHNWQKKSLITKMWSYLPCFGLVPQKRPPIDRVTYQNISSCLRWGKSPKKSWKRPFGSDKLWLGAMNRAQRRKKNKDSVWVWGKKNDYVGSVKIIPPKPAEWNPWTKKMKHCTTLHGKTPRQEKMEHKMKVIHCVWCSVVWCDDIRRRKRTQHGKDSKRNWM